MGPSLEDLNVMMLSEVQSFTRPMKKCTTRNINLKQKSPASFLNPGVHTSIVPKIEKEDKIQIR